MIRNRSSTAAPSLMRITRMATSPDAWSRPAMYVPSGDHATPGLRTKVPNAQRAVGKLTRSYDCSEPDGGPWIPP